MDVRLLTDDDLVKACAARGAPTSGRAASGPEALGELVRRYQDPLLGYLAKFLGDPRLAEDLAQEAFMRVYAKSATYRPGPKFTTWLYTIATNLARDTHKYARRHPAGPLASSALDVRSSEPDPESAALRREREERVRRALDALPEETREVLLLRDVQGLSYEEIAQVQGTPVGTAKSRVSRARMAFKDVYAAHGGITTSILQP